ncbi:WhiB family transcriptional regulator [Streptomyces sp. NBC_01353]|uniref:WhiB family transcriptional regulator n=1 Tax=Streptomyces sp. NBC_01353 TaxID=2903835 RepID=UPI002E2FAB45|nr:WhiB family transcriptional regulator [Streptomyces sp. NBC_01353]
MESWRRFAACRTQVPDLLLPVGTGAPAPAQAEEAKRVCQGCPAKACLGWPWTTHVRCRRSGAETAMDRATGGA